MLYLANPCGPAVVEAMRSGVIGFIDTPAQGNRRPPGLTWCADNGCFSNRWDEDRWWKFLTANAHEAGSCLFAVAPDVVGDAAATLAKSAPWLPRIRELGYPAALVAQDGLEHLDVPWDTFDCLFIGGSTRWKTSLAAQRLAAEAKARGKWLHMGRVNSARRFRLARDVFGCDSADGTHITFHPEENLGNVLAWTASHPHQPLF